MCINVYIVIVKRNEVIGEGPAPMGTSSDAQPEVAPSGESVVVFDADTHYYEPRDAFTRHIGPKFRDRTVRVERAQDQDQIFIDGSPFGFLSPLYDRVAPPGSLREMLRHLSDSGSISNTGVDVEMQAAFVDRDARLEVLDEQGVDACLLLPSLGVCIEHSLQHDVDLLYASLRSFNDWLFEDWGYAHLNRLYGVPLLSLLDIDQAVAELDRVLDRGARVVHLRPGPVAGRSPADPLFDPFWERIQEADVAVAFHISESGYNELFSVHWGEAPNPASHAQSAFQWTCSYGDRPIMDTMAALVLHNLFGRFPGVRVASLENGSLWVPYLLKAMDKMRGMGRRGPWLGGPIEGRPSEIFRRHVYVAPYHEEDIAGLIEVLGPSQVLFGSDFPHPEGLADPVREFSAAAAFGGDIAADVLGGNARRLIGVGTP